MHARISFMAWLLSTTPLIIQLVNLMFHISTVWVAISMIIGIAAIVGAATTAYMQSANFEKRHKDLKNEIRSLKATLNLRDNANG